MQGSLGQYESDCKDRCLERYYQAAQGGITDQKTKNGDGEIVNIEIPADTILRSGVIYSATVARDNGITMPDGQPVYEEELRRLEYKLAAADVKIRKLISGKQFYYEMGAGRFGEKLDLMLRRLAAMYVMQADRRTVKDYENEILDFMEEDEGKTNAAKRYQYYHASAQRELRKNPVRYENRKEDATYFF